MARGDRRYVFIEPMFVAGCTNCRAAPSGVLDRPRCCESRSVSVGSSPGLCDTQPLKRHEFCCLQVILSLTSGTALRIPSTLPTPPLQGRSASESPASHHSSLQERLTSMWTIQTAHHQDNKDYHPITLSFYLVPRRGSSLPRLAIPA